MGEDISPKKERKSKMDAVSYKTVSANKDIVKKEWLVIDAQELVVGRLATTVARILKGKHKTYYTPSYFCGDEVVIINAEKVKFTGKKWTDKEYVHHTTYPGGQRFATPKDFMRKYPERIIEHAVKGMLPKNKLGAEMFRHLHVYVGPNHKHENQDPKPRVININDIK